MRHLLILMMIATMPAADAPPQELFTLTDGRVIKGSYDEAAHKLSIDGGAMIIQLMPDQIKERKPAPIEVAAEPKEPKEPKVKDKPKPAVDTEPKEKPEAAKEAMIAKLEKEAEQLKKDMVPLRVNPAKINGPGSSAEWQQGTPEYKERQQKLAAMVLQHNAKIEEIKMLRNPPTPSR